MREGLLLWVDAGVNLVLGALLLAVPTTLASLLGLPPPEPGFYARVLGGVLLGIGAALVAEATRGPRLRGLGLAGAVAVNVTAGAVLAALLAARGMDLPPRGLAVLGGLVVALLLLSGLEVRAVMGGPRGG